MNQVKPVTILLIEDNPGDVFLFQETLTDVDPSTKYNIEIVKNGRDAIHFLHREDCFGEVVLPDIIVLDINLPIKSGREVYMDIISDPELKRIPVAILTSSIFDRDLCNMHPEGLCSYFEKTFDYERFQEIVNNIIHIRG